MSNKKGDVIIKAESLAEAYAVAFEEAGPEFDVLEIKKVSSGAFGATSIQIKVSPVKRKSSASVVNVQTVAPKSKVVNQRTVIEDDDDLDNVVEVRLEPVQEEPNVSWEEVVFQLRDSGFTESVIIKMLSEIKTSGKHLKVNPYSLVEDRLVYHCVNETSAAKSINILFAEPSSSSSAGVSAYLFSKYAKQGLSSNKVILTNSTSKLKKVLGRDFLNILHVNLLEVTHPQDWLASSSVILEQSEVCCVFFQDHEAEAVLPEVPDAMGTLSYTKLIQWGQALGEDEIDFLKECKAQLFVTGLEGNSSGSLLAPSLKFEIPTGFVLRGKEFLSGLIHSSDLIKQVIEEMSGNSEVETRRVG